MRLTNLVQRHKRLAWAVVGIAVAPFTFKVTCACFDHSETGTNLRIIDQMNPQKLEPPLPPTVCGTDLYIKQKADEAVFIRVAEELAQDSYERKSQGLPPRSAEEIKSLTLTKFQEQWRNAVELVTKPKQPKTAKLLSPFRRVIN